MGFGTSMCHQKKTKKQSTRKICTLHMHLTNLFFHQKIIGVWIKEKIWCTRCLGALAACEQGWRRFCCQAYRSRSSKVGHICTHLFFCFFFFEWKHTRTHKHTHIYTHFLSFNNTQTNMCELKIFPLLFASPPTKVLPRLPRKGARCSLASNSWNENSF